MQDVMGVLDKEGEVGVGVLREEVAWEGLEGDDGREGRVEMLGRRHCHRRRRHSHIGQQAPPSFTRGHLWISNLL